MLLKNRLKDVREKIGYDVQTLSEVTGITRQALYKIENCQVNPRIDTVVKIANALDLDLDYLFYRN